MGNVIKDFLEKELPFETEAFKKVFEKSLGIIGLESEEVIKDFLSPGLSNFNDPFLMKDMDKAAAIFEEAIKNNKRITLFGDYDADGVTSTALFVKVLSFLGHDNYDYFIPDRQRDGYGISEENIKKVVKKSDLVITADNGIREINSLHNLDIPVIITDHHDPIVGEIKDLKRDYKNGKIIEGENISMAIPNVEAILNPKRIDCGYPNECLAGVGVLFKLFQGLFKVLGKNQKDLLPFLDLVAVGTIADLVPQFDKKHQNIEVRLMTALGIQFMNEQPDVWVDSFKRVNRKDELVYNDLGFAIGPNLNAPSRMGSAYPAVDFLIEKDPDLSFELAVELREINEKRKRTQKEAIKKSDTNLFVTDNVVVTVLDEEFDSGIAGLVAGHYLNETKKPSITFCKREVDGKEVLTGSCRSIEGASIIDSLTEVSAKIGPFKFGGHDEAAGLTIPSELIDSFKVEIDKSLEKYNINKLNENLDYDIELSLSEIDFSIVSFVNKLFLPITFISKGNRLYSPPVPLRDPRWARTFLENNGVRYQAMLWNNADVLSEAYRTNTDLEIDITYQLSFFKGDISLSINDFSVV